MTILVLNSGSSSFKFAVYRSVDAASGAPCEPVERLRGQVHGLPDTPVMVWRTEGGEHGEIALPAPADQRRALKAVLARLQSDGLIDRVEAVGHRVVHGGGALVAPCLVDESTLGLVE